MSIIDRLFIMMMFESIVYVILVWYQYKLHKAELKQETDYYSKVCESLVLNTNDTVKYLAETTKHLEDKLLSMREDKETLLYILQKVKNQNALLIKQLDASSGCAEKN